MVWYGRDGSRWLPCPGRETPPSRAKLDLHRGKVRPRRASCRPEFSVSRAVYEGGWINKISISPKHHHKSSAASLAESPPERTTSTKWRPPFPRDAAVRGLSTRYGGTSEGVTLLSDALLPLSSTPFCAGSDVVASRGVAQHRGGLHTGPYRAQS